MANQVVNAAIEPGVIDFEMLNHAIKEQGPTGEAGRLAAEENIPMDRIKKIRLEFLNILRIDHLWVLPNLTKLSLSNNRLEVIENIHMLVHLVELDLSFNKIAKIERLNELKNLEMLNLYNNEISVIENMDTLKRLAVLSIGKNKIENRQNVIYLRNFEHLKSLNLAGNPCAAEEDFRLFIAAFLPQLVYYEYKLIRPDERTTAEETFNKELTALQEEEETMKLLKTREMAELEEQDQHAESFVEMLGDGQLFDSLFEGDSEGMLLLTMGEEAQESYKEYQEQFKAITRELFEYGMEQFKIRKAEVTEFLECAEKAKTESQTKSQEVMEKFMDKKFEIMLKVKTFQESIDTASTEVDTTAFYEQILKFSEEYNQLIHTTWKELMRLEIFLYEQMEEANQAFDQTLTEMVQGFLEKARGNFTSIRNLELLYAENISSAGGNFMSVPHDEPSIGTELFTLIQDKEVFNNAVATSHESHMQIIDAREDKLVSRATNWLHGLVNDLQKNEVTRNRNKVLEISNFLDMQREAFEELNQMVATPKDQELIDFLDSLT